jgi:hypothetical protein
MRGVAFAVRSMNTPPPELLDATVEMDCPQDTVATVLATIAARAAKRERRFMRGTPSPD